VGAAAVCSAGMLLGGCAGKGTERRGAREAEATKSAAMRAGGQENAMLAAPQEQKISVNAEHGGVKFEYTISDIDDGDGAFFFPEAWEKGGFGDAPSAPAGYPQLGEWRHSQGKVTIEVKGAPQLLIVMNQNLQAWLEDEVEMEHRPKRPGSWSPARTRRINVTNGTADATFEMTMVDGKEDVQPNITVEKVLVSAGTVTVLDPYLGIGATVTGTAQTQWLVEVQWSGENVGTPPRKKYNFVLTPQGGAGNPN